MAGDERSGRSGGDFPVVLTFLRLPGRDCEGEILFTRTGFQATRSEKFIRISR